MSHKIWLVTLVAALALNTGCSREEPTAAAPSAPATEKSVEKSPPVAAATPSGKTIYEGTCASCHDTGVAGAPRLGDKSAWGMHLAEGLDHLVQVAIEGEGAMPPRGGNPELSDEEVRAAVDYMLDQVR
jgi:cytochrome c5